MMIEKLLPQNIEAECGVLGSLIIDPEAIAQVADFLQADDFYRNAHRTIYEIMLRFFDRHEPADFIELCDELTRRNMLEEVGGSSYISSLVNQVPTSGNVEFYGRIVERTAVLRRLIHGAGQIAACAYEQAEDAYEQSERIIYAIGTRRGQGDFEAMTEITSGYLNEHDYLHEHRAGLDRRAQRRHQLQQVCWYLLAGDEQAPTSTTHGRYDRACRFAEVTYGVDRRARLGQDCRCCGHAF